MTPERWQEIERLYHSALQRKNSERAAYLKAACPGDDALRKEVESLLSHGKTADGWLEGRALRDLAEEVFGKQNGQSLVGKQLGSYQVLSLIGTGGMGEVYEARDAKLQRNVALKVLPPAFVYDPERLERFQREARMLAALNHPNVATIYGLEHSDDVHYLLMELVPGETLAERISKGALPVDEALRVAREVAEGLEAAHERGIVHRDLKPANVKVTPQGRVKVLDFGLAKAFLGNAEQDLSQAAALGPTEEGRILGTPSYMSPEQARGKTVDKRTDIWAFGCVLYEMLTGQIAFRGDTLTDTLAAVLKTEPDWSQLPAATPVRVRVPLQRCLQKDPKQRLRDIGDARISLDEVLSGAPEPTVTGAAKVSTPLWRRAVPWALFGATGVALAAFAWLYETQLRTASPAQTVRLQIPLPAKPPLHLSGLFAVSPDGRKLAFVATSTDGIPRIWIRSMDSLEIRPLKGTESVSTELFWSPDSRFVGFDAGQNLEKIDISGGPPETVCAVDAAPVGGSWNKDGVIIFGRFGKSLMRVSAAGGVATPLTVLNTAHGDVAHTEPWFLPDGRHFLYLRDTGPSGFVSVGSLDAKPEEQDSRRLAETGYGAVYVLSANASSGQLLFLRRGALMAQAFDARDMKLSGEPVSIEDGPIEAFLDAGLFSISATGTLVYWSRGNVENEPTWFDAQGKALGKVGEPGAYRGVSLSWDGTKAFLSRQNPGEISSLWLLDVARGTSTRSDVNLAADDRPPLWAADGRNIIFGVEDQPGQMVDIYEKPLSGAAAATLLIKSNEWKTPSSWSADGRFLLYTVFEGDSKNHLWVFPLAARQKPFPFHRSEFNEHDGYFSPNGHWVAYVSDESGRSEIYVRPFSPDPSGEGVSDTGDKFLISDGGGYSPAWRQDGRELYYLDSDTRLMAVSVTTHPAFHADAPRFLFQAPVRSSGRFGRTAWAPSPDGKRFLFLVPEAQGETPFTVVLNWQSLLKK